MICEKLTGKVDKNARNHFTPFPSFPSKYKDDFFFSYNNLVGTKIEKLSPTARRQTCLSKVGNFTKKQEKCASSTKGLEIIQNWIFYEDDSSCDSYRWGRGKWRFCNSFLSFWSSQGQNDLISYLSIHRGIDSICNSAFDFDQLPNPFLLIFKKKIDENSKYKKKIDFGFFF